MNKLIIENGVIDISSIQEDVRSKGKRNKALPVQDKNQMSSPLEISEKDLKHWDLMYFAKNAHTGLPGHFNQTINKVSYILASRGYSLETITQHIQKHAPQDLDDTDLNTINSGFYSGEAEYTPQYKSVADFVPDMLDRMGGKFTIDGMFRQGSKIVTTDKLINDLHVKSLQLNIKRGTSKNIEALVINEVNIARETELKKLNEKLQYAGPNDSVHKFISAIVGTPEAANEEQVIKHFIWQTKRKLLGLKPEHHMMPVLYGKTGSGKTVAINNLLKPLSGVVTTGDFGMLSDSREKFRLTENYVVFLDEMAKAGKADVESIKNSITSARIDYRILGHSREIKGVNNATFIGATNQELSIVINDPTSVRRFYEIKTLDKLDWETINSLDYLSMWKSVDPYSICPISEYLEEIKAKQEDMRSKDPVELFIQEKGIRSSFKKGSFIYPLKNVYKSYKCWADDNGYRALGSANFGKKFKSFIGEKNQVRRSSGVAYHLYVEDLDQYLTA